MRTYITIVFFAVLSGAVSAAGWIVDERVDAMTDARKKSAMTFNDDGHGLAIYRLSDGSVWMNFVLDPKSLELLGDRLPLFRIDKNKPVNIETMRGLQQLSRKLKQPKIYYKAEPRWVNFRIYHGEGPPSSGTLHQLMTGEQVVFRYYLFTGGHKETQFSLSGAKRAIDATLALQ